MVEIVLGGKVHHVTIEPDGDSGHTKPVLSLDDFPDQDSEEFAPFMVNRTLVLLAGQESERLICGEHDPDQQEVEQAYEGVPISRREVQAPYDRDNEDLITCLRQLEDCDDEWVTATYEEDGSARYHDSRLRNRCREILIGHRAAVEAVARALEARDTLEGEDVERLIREAGG